jgi:hypothetical protein
VEQQKSEPEVTCSTDHLFQVEFAASSASEVAKFLPLRQIFRSAKNRSSGTSDQQISGNKRRCGQLFC